MNFSQNSKRIAFCGVLGALAVVILTFGGIFPFATFACPVLAMFLILPIIAEFGYGTALIFYIAVALLGLLLTPDKEVALLFAFLGYYPILKQKLDCIRSKPLRVAGKLLVFNIAVTAMYLLMISVLKMEVVSQEFAGMSAFLLAALYLLGNVVFFLCDTALQRMMYQYLTYYRKKLFRK